MLSLSTRGRFVLSFQRVESRALMARKLTISNSSLRHTNLQTIVETLCSAQEKHTTALLAVQAPARRWLALSLPENLRRAIHGVRKEYLAQSLKGGFVFRTEPSSLRSPDRHS